MQTAVERREAPPPHQRGGRPRQPPGGADRKAPPKRVSQARWRLPALHSLVLRGKERDRAPRCPEKTQPWEQRSVGFSRICAGKRRSAMRAPINEVLMSVDAATVRRIAHLARI